MFGQILAEIFSIGSEGAIHIFGVKLVGFRIENLTKLALTLVILFIIWLFARLLRFFVRRYMRGRVDARAVFWSNQAIGLMLAFLSLIAFISIWFDDPGRLATALGLITLGLAFALQKIIVAIAGYFMILKGRLFNVGDRISMAGVRGDVITLSFTYTRVMEMGQSPAVQLADPAMWVEARQYTGRIVTITNDKVFEAPLYNYTREFPFIWEEMHFFLKYESDRQNAERIILEAAKKHTVGAQELGQDALAELKRRYMVAADELDPRVYYRLTDNWLELSVRFICSTYNIRGLKDKLSRDILDGFEKGGIDIASATVEVVGLPTIKIRREKASG